MAGIPPSLVSDFTVPCPGRGITGIMVGGHGTLATGGWLLNWGLPQISLHHLPIRCNNRANPMMLMDEEHVQALFAMVDTLKSYSRDAITQLHQLDVNTLMLSGDDTLTTKAIAPLPGINEAYGNLLPADKLQKITQLPDRGTVSIVNNSINDGVAMALAVLVSPWLYWAGIPALRPRISALMEDDLRKLGNFIQLPHTTH